ncbi:MAG: xanthine dehydrogenase family protein subunit M [Burkholderiaceae bacterium]|nr:xanthine dehydrogenase family protein subunit M [Burkholderiaceae bacterium]
MHHTHYHRPTTVADAVKLLGQHPDDKILAGGQSMLPSIRLGLASVEGFIDLAAIPDLQGVRIDGNTVRIGAMTTHATVAASKDIAARIWRRKKTLAEGIGDRQVRNRGTIGGSLANSDPAACYPAAVLGLNATIHTNLRQIAADQWLKGLYETALAPDEIITAVSFPVPEKAGYLKFKQPASRFAIVGVFVAKTAGGVRVAVTGAGSHAFRVKVLEDRLAAKWAPESCDGVTVSPDGLNGDLHGSAEYRAHLIPVMAKRAVMAAG